MFRHDLDVSNSTSSGDPISIEDDVFVDEDDVLVAEDEVLGEGYS